jgi:hypothetical protein
MVKSTSWHQAAVPGSISAYPTVYWGAAQKSWLCKVNKILKIWGVFLSKTPILKNIFSFVGVASWQILSFLLIDNVVNRDRKCRNLFTYCDLLKSTFVEHTVRSWSWSRHAMRFRLRLHKTGLLEDYFAMPRWQLKTSKCHSKRGGGNGLTNQNLAFPPHPLHIPLTWHSGTEAVTSGHIFFLVSRADVFSVFLTPRRNLGRGFVLSVHCARIQQPSGVWKVD